MTPQEQREIAKMLDARQDALFPPERTVHQTFAAIRALGLAVTREDGEWRVNYRGGREATAHYTEDNEDALGTARAMVAWRSSQ